ncbi:hypothetical protein DDD63_06725 [Actinobaculum sp. 313]|nr:hypothetical protein DDD63_06725 [Actinobaculum sp. 313]
MEEAPHLLDDIVALFATELATRVQSGALHAGLNMERLPDLPHYCYEPRTLIDCVSRIGADDPSTEIPVLEVNPIVAYVCRCDEHVLGRFSADVCGSTLNVVGKGSRGIFNDSPLNEMLYPPIAWCPHADAAIGWDSSGT